MAGGGGHDHVLQAQHLGLLPGGPPPVPVPGRLLAPADAEDRGELRDGGAAGVAFHRATIVERPRVAVPLALLLEVAVGAEEAGGAAAERGRGGTARGAERRPGVAAGHRVGAVDVAVARQAEPGGVGPAVHHRRQACAEVARRRRHRLVGGARDGHGFQPRDRAESASARHESSVGALMAVLEEEGK